MSVLSEGALPADDADAVVDHDAAPGDFPVGDGPLSAGVRRTLRGAGWVDPVAVDVPAADGDDVLASCAALGLRGRGWGDARRDEPVAGAGAPPATPTATPSWS